VEDCNLHFVRYCRGSRLSANSRGMNAFIAIKGVESHRLGMMQIIVWYPAAVAGLSGLAFCDECLRLFYP
jgi:hypothetical protein